MLLIFRLFLRAIK